MSVPASNELLRVSGCLKILLLRLLQVFLLSETIVCYRRYELRCATHIRPMRVFKAA